MVRIARMPEGGIGWVGREGIELLDLGAHRVAEGVLDRFARRSDGTIEWDLSAAGTVVGSADAVGELLRGALDEFAPDCECLVFIWDSLAVPSVRASRRIVAGILAEITDVFAEFWVICEGTEVLVEDSSFKDRLVVARVSR